MEPIEYMTIAWDYDDVARMIEQLNKLGAQGWEACALVHAKAGSDVIGRVPPGQHQVQLLLLKRHKAA